MTEIIIATLILYLAQLILPNMIAVARKELDNSYLFGPRDEAAGTSAVPQRAKRAAVNMQESMIVFLPLAALAVATSAPVAEIATVWLGLRLAYLVTYLMGVGYIRTLIWMASVVCLALMAIELV
jgi:uncharacterized MAPEG superfamily protein